MFDQIIYDKLRASPFPTSKKKPELIPEYVRFFNDLDDSEINKYDYLHLFVIAAEWEEVIKIYQVKYLYWAWNIKNSMSIYEIYSEQYAEDLLALPQKIFRYCPESQRVTVVTSIDSYSTIYGEKKSGSTMGNFIASHSDFVAR